MIDLFSQGQLGKSGYVRQEEVPLALFLANRFGCHYESKVASRFAFSDADEVQP
jgi:hypothetical protein